MQGITITLLINILINNILRIWARTIKNFYSDEAYLTHTLPIKKETLFLSKVLTTIITLLTSTLVIVISLLICYYSKENIEILKNILNQINISNITVDKYNINILSRNTIFNSNRNNSNNFRI